MSRIVTVEDAGPSRRARRLVLEDSAVVLTSLAVVRSLGIEPGSECDVMLEHRIRVEESAQAKDRALLLLGYKDRTVAELTSKLHDDGYPSETVSSIVQSMVDYGYIDDARYAQNWVSARTRAGYGRRRIVGELRRKGVAEDRIETAFCELEGYDAVAAAHTVIASCAVTDQRSRQRALRRLLSRGFELGTALAALGGSEHRED